MVKRNTISSQEETPSKIAKVDSRNSEFKVHSKKKFSKLDKLPQRKITKSNNETNGEKTKFKNFQKGKFDKQKRTNNDTSKPPDWKEYKKKKKDLLVQRKQNNKNLFDVIVKAKQIGETLRRKTVEGGKAERDKLINELHEMLGGNYIKLVLSHDMARIVQYMLKFGNQKIREEIAAEITPSTVEMLQSKYARYCIKRLFKYGNAKTRSCAVKAMYGSAVKLTSHVVSAPIFEFAYSTWAQPLEKVHLTQEFFGDLYKQTKEDNIKHLRDVYEKSPDMKAAALGATKANISKILNKNLLDSELVQTVLYQYISECSEADRNELLTQLSPHVVILSNSKDGSKAVMEFIWYGTNKDRKVIMKALKEHTLELCKHEYGHTVLIALLDAIDDTVLVNKMIISEIIKNTLDIAKDDWGRKVILWLVAPGNSTHFHPTFTKELECGRQKSNSKKSAEARRKEVLGYTLDTLVSSIKTDTRAWLENASLAVVTLAILKTGSGELLSEALACVAEVVVDADWKIKENETELLGVEHAGMHMTLKKLIQNDKNATQDGKPTFCEALLQYLANDVIKSWLKLNRGCFLLIAMIENGSADIVEKLRAQLKKHVKRIKKENTAGSKILLKKVE